MSTVPHDHRPRFQQLPAQKVGQARAGNQNARRHGLYSTLDPRSPDELAAIAREAATEHDIVKLKAVARAYDRTARRSDRDRELKYRALARGLRRVIRDQERAAIASAADAIMVAHTLPTR